MKNSLIIISFLITVLMIPSLLLAVERAPRISDREIVERLTRLEEGQKHLRSEMNNRFDGVDKRFDDLRSEMNSRFQAIDKRFDIIQWMLG
ncbi:MAG: hypothetical protein JRE64_16040, partial [Deltaproteobacteria bacterium]|nr:hypothetical protein [Deltaproteobacteria bacterium]